MTDSSFSYMEVSAKRKKRNQFISVLIIVAIVMVGAIVWGWIELQKSRNAERIKNALNSQVEPGFKEPEGTLEPLNDSDSPMGEEAAVAEQMTPAETETGPVAPESKARPERPTRAESRKAVKPAAKTRTAKSQVRKPTRTKEAYSSEVEAEPVQIAMVEPVIKTEANLPVPEPKTAIPTKAYPPEDLPMPEKAEATEEIRQAMVSSPKPMAPAGDAGVQGSNNFKLGMQAYKAQDYVNAIRSFSAISKPGSKKRGVPERDEYVQANFLKGVSLLKVGHLSEAVTAFHNVLDYEKYYPLANMNLGICYVELKQYAKAHQAFESVVRDHTKIDPVVFDDVMQRTKYFWAIAWTRLFKNATNPDKQNFYRQQAILKWKDYQVWFSKNDKYKSENTKAENYLKSLNPL